jgi:hypothetical protein
MTKNEQSAVVKIIRHMQQLQKQITKPSIEDATEEEVLMLFNLLWRWTSTANKPLPSKHTIEKLVGLFRGCDKGQYCYISRERVAEIIRKEHLNHKFGDDMLIFLNKNYEKMSDVQLYENGRWNYQETPLVKMLCRLHSNPELFQLD